MAFSQLPQELVDKIVDEFSPDGRSGRRALVACSLVCRVFLERCRARLYQKLRIESAKVCSEACAIAKCNPRIIHLVRHIRVQSWRAACPVLDAFKDLQALELDLARSPEVLIGPFRFPSMRDMTLRSGNLGVPFNVVAILLSSCTSLSSLTLSNLRMDPGKSVNGQKSIPIRRLVISCLYGSQEKAGAWLAACIESLEVIETTLAFNEDACIVKDLFQMIGNNLKSLSICIKSLECSLRNPFPRRPLFLSTCTNLSFLRITEGSHVNREDIDGWVLDRLEQIGSRVLKHVQLDLCSSLHIDSFDWSRLQHALSRKLQPLLERLTVIFSTPDGGQEKCTTWPSQVYDNMSELAARVAVESDIRINAFWDYFDETPPVLVYSHRITF